MAKKKVLLSGLAMALTAAVLLAGYQRLVQPKYMSDVVEGNLIADYYNSGMDHDVLFVGDCECYENFSPVTLWRNYGISSCIRGSAQQLSTRDFAQMRFLTLPFLPSILAVNRISVPAIKTP